MSLCDEDNPCDGLLFVCSTLTPTSRALQPVERGLIHRPWALEAWKGVAAECAPVVRPEAFAVILLPALGISLSGQLCWFLDALRVFAPRSRSIVLAALPRLSRSLLN